MTEPGPRRLYQGQISQPKVEMNPRGYLPTTPATQLEITSLRGWCAGHPWRSRRGLGWLHRAGHLAGILRNQPRRLPLAYVDLKGREGA